MVLPRILLKTLAREKTVPLPVEGDLKFARMGCNSHGPLMLVPADGACTLIDVETLRPLSGGEKAMRRNGHFGFDVRVLADGQTFVGWVTGLDATGFSTLRFLSCQRGAQPDGRRSGRGEDFAGNPAAQRAPALCRRTRETDDRLSRPGRDAALEPENLTAGEDGAVDGHGPRRQSAHGLEHAGALLVWTTGQPVLWDCEAMKPIAVEGPLIGNDANFRQHVRVLADGRVFISGTDRMSGQHFHVMEKATTASSIATGRTLPASIRSMPCWRATRRGPRGCGSPTARRLALPSASWARPTGGSSRA